MKYPGYTWTPTTKADDVNDHHDRLDFILYRGEGIKLKSVDIIGENKENATIVVDPYPSDHRAVTAVFELGTGDIR
jgi:exodeoxyribonuclease-3